MIIWREKRIKILIIFLLILIIVIIFYYVNNNIFNNLSDVINNNKPIRKWAIAYINKSYNNETSTFINILLFNEKNYNFEIYNSLKQMNILQLFVVSGLHINCLISIINYIFKKNKYIKNILSIFICFILFYFVNFSISCLRILILQIIKILNNKISSLNNNLLTGYIIIFLSPRDTVSYSFYLSFICIITINIISIGIKNNYLQLTLINVLLPIVVLPITLSFNNYFNIYSFLFNYIFNPLILFTFITCLLLCWIPILFTIINRYINWIYNLLNIKIDNQLFYMNIHSIVIYVFYFLMIIIVNIVLKTNQYKKEF